MLVVQEGGYKVRSLGINARHFFTGLWDEMNTHKYQAI
jgi:acetoin utilization deacetylase AcuC-like enzyme